VNDVVNIKEATAAGSMPCASCGGHAEPSKEMELMFEGMAKRFMICTACALNHVSAVLRLCSDYVRRTSSSIK
jgi:hypothetical protein